MSEKDEIREMMRLRRKMLSPAERARSAEVICEKILGRADLAPGSVCAVYLASKDEIDLSLAIDGLLKRGVMVAAPRWNGETYELAGLDGLNGDSLRKGPMGILEPAAENNVDASSVDVWLVPGLAFTRAGGRLGYGGGWYDRLMARAKPHAVKLGIAYGFQVMDALPIEAHDIGLSEVVDNL